MSADSPAAAAAAAVGVVRQHLVPGPEPFLRAQPLQGQLAPGQGDVPADRARACGTGNGGASSAAGKGRWDQGKKGKVMVKTSSFLHGCCCSASPSSPAIPVIPE